ncbi:MAG: alpha-L-fucosidase [Planctomycetes bacterium]|nr:alpha-L-fucosidase [Planctomycetota bacterium]
MCASLLASLSLVCATVANAAPQAELNDARLEWWRAARFGMFIHWGPVSLRGTEIGWSRGAQVPTDEYDRLYERFDPKRFDADEWAKTAQAAGMRYIVLTAKHHDGFCLWDTRFTDYDIMASLCKRDIVAELSAACRRHGLKFCVYYSICDWHHPDYPTDSPGGRGKKAEPNMPRYVEYLRNQLKELLTRYGPLGLVWFDGQWEQPWTAAYGTDLYRYLRELQPDLIINNRVSKGSDGQSGTSRQDARNPGDYDTPEQRIGAFNRERPWETCLTLCQQWAWKPEDQMKSLPQCLQTLVRVVGGDGNLLLNVGPMPDGRIEPRQVQRLAEMGVWLSKYGESVYGTRGGPLMPNPHAVSTHKGTRIYLHVFRWPDEPLVLPPISRSVVKSAVMTGGSVQVEQTSEGILVNVPKADRQEIDTIVVLELDGPAATIAPCEWCVPSSSLAYNAAARASNVFRNMPDYAAEKAVDDDDQTRWATDAGTRQAWLEVDLGEARRFSQVLIREADEFGQRVQRFQLEIWEAEAWKVVLRGDTLGGEYKGDFPPVTARRVRLNILEATEGPTIWEFQLFERSPQGTGGQER